jgi:hypothetical protein
VSHSIPTRLEFLGLSCVQIKQKQNKPLGNTKGHFEIIRGTRKKQNILGKSKVVTVFKKYKP